MARIVLHLILVTFFASSAMGEAGNFISWADLRPSQAVPLDDPFAELSSEQVAKLSQIVRIRRLIEEKKCSPTGRNSEEEKKLVAGFSEQGIDVEWLLSQRERVIELRRNRANAGGDGVVSQRIRIPGYILPLNSEDGRVTEFLLVPWIGGCIHAKIPGPNQTIHVSYPEGIIPKSRFAPTMVEGFLTRSPSVYQLFLLDGRRSVETVFNIESDRVSFCTPDELKVLQSDATADLAQNGTWFEILQIKASMLFTKTMNDIENRQSSGPVWIGLFIAFAYGLLHTLGPGHGKTVVISYFVGEGGSLTRGIRMGFQIALCHVFSAVLVVWLTDVVVRQATGHAPSNYHFIKLISYAAIAVIGLLMLVGSLRAVCVASAHEHHEEGCSCGHHKSPKGWGGWIALAVGSVPCTGAILVLLFGMANNVLLPAILMVICMSFGMAVAMASIGIAAILSRNFADQKFELNARPRMRFSQSVRIAGALVILLIGLTLYSFTFIQYRNAELNNSMNQKTAIKTAMCGRGNQSS